MAEPYPIVTLKSGAEIHLRNRHHAIFRSAIQRLPDIRPGDIAEVRDALGGFLCYATINPKAYICGRAISFHPGNPLDAMRACMERAIRLRQEIVARNDITAYRLINAEGDGIPGLIVDRYADILVVQCTTLGMDRLRSWIADTLHALTGTQGIYEKSTATARKKEGLEPREGWLRGSGDTRIEVQENGLIYDIELCGGQKTGLFLDQRDMRAWVRSLGPGRTVLDCCSYVGGFSLSALAGGAAAADAVDYDADALAQARRSVQRNGMDDGRFQTYAEDVFDFLRRSPLPQAYDFIILDPPAFAKRSADIDQAKRAYTDLNRLAMQALPAGSLLLTCSCSYHMDAGLFQTAVFHAARQADRFVRILGRHRQAFDHPVSLNYPEGDYLKSMLLWVE